MPEAHARPGPSLVPIERPRCPKCQDRMGLRRIELVLTVLICGLSNAPNASTSTKYWLRIR